MENESTNEFVNKIKQFGFPSFNIIQTRKSYIIAYDTRNRVPYCVFEYLTSSLIAKDESVNRKNIFFEDKFIHPFFRSTNLDYKDSGYDRGHLAAAGNHTSSQEFRDDTFVLSNMSPQVREGFNRHKWSDLEKRVRGLVKISKCVYVCTGPLYLPTKESDGKRYVKYEVIGEKDVAVPTHFFKVILCETKKSKFKLECYVMPNAPIEDSLPLETFLVTKEFIEKAAGFLFFENFPFEMKSKL